MSPAISPATSPIPPSPSSLPLGGLTLGVQGTSVNPGPRSPNQWGQAITHTIFQRCAPAIARHLTGAIAAGMAGGTALLLGASPPALAQSPAPTPAPSPDLAERLTLPRPVHQAVLQEAARQSQAAPGEIRILDFQAEVWPDGCLGLGQANEACTQGLVSGWHVIASDGQRRWLYRTNANGQLMRSDEAGLDRLTSRSDANGSLPSNRPFINPPLPTTTAPLPQERQPPAARITPRNDRATITLINRTNAPINFEVIGDTSLRQLPGQRSTRLLDLPLPSTVNLRRQDGGLLRILPSQQGPAHGLEVFLDVEIDLGLDRTTLLIEPDGSVFLN